MFKIKGKIYPVSLLKVYLPDEVGARLDFVAKTLRIHPVDVLIPQINGSYERLCAELKRVQDEETKTDAESKGEAGSVPQK